MTGSLIYDNPGLGEFGFDVIPTRHYQRNSAHQLISTLAYNLARNFQIDAGIAKARPASAGRMNVLAFESLKTFRFERIAVAGWLVNAAGAKILKLSQSARREQVITEIAHQPRGRLNSRRGAQECRV